jgi:hypothetical protein
MTPKDEATISRSIRLSRYFMQKGNLERARKHLKVAKELFFDLKL